MNHSRNVHSRADDPPNSYFPDPGLSHASKWMLGIAAAIVASGILFGAKSLYDMNAQLAVINWRLSQIEQKIGASPISHETLVVDRK